MESGGLSRKKVLEFSRGVPLSLWSNTHLCTHGRKLPEVREKDHWKGVGGTISGAQIELGTVQVLINQSKKDLFHGEMSNVLRKVLLQ